MPVSYLVGSDFNEDGHPVARFEDRIEPYEVSEKLDAKDVRTILGVLLRNMRLGHAAALLMQMGVLEETVNGLRYEKPSVKDGSGIWQHILLGSH